VWRSFISEADPLYISERLDIDFANSSPASPVFGEDAADISRESMPNIPLSGCFRRDISDAVGPSPITSAIFVPEEASESTLSEAL
jgi:hypothetical protein